ncbi:DNA-binding transcriptional LysR family regulator [Chitinivorax tropicus]|uniref:DNA-binding transcriptional LysR family regulator n=1 Tax=Chitinivorax tropicus TaxID=714531 RepID=A0A840MHK8_9PROT|nr:LysR family transcriptional regulator [Chitinivorax tropicus]MBB5017005.1 DNA-binding transcriptional LysR family regulator [Chitinivorax tropicus]
MDIVSLKIFHAVAETGSVTRAAEQLHYVQSNVTARIKQLEASLGVRLFHRQPRQMQLTPSGEVLLRYAARIIRLMEEARSAVSDQGCPHGPLTLGTMETTAASRLPAILPRYHARYPDVELNLQTGTTGELVPAVLELKLTAALVAAPLSHPDLAQDVVFQEELVLVTSASCVTQPSPAQIGEMAIMVFRPGCMYRANLERWLAHVGAIPRRSMVFGSFDAIMGCVAAGMGMSMMPLSVVQQHRLYGAVRIHPMPKQFAHAPTLLIYRRDMALTSAMRAFRDLLLEHHEPLPMEPGSDGLADRHPIMHDSVSA